MNTDKFARALIWKNICEWLFLYRLLTLENLSWVIETTRFFKKVTPLTPGWRWYRVKQKLSNIPRLKICDWKTIRFLCPGYHLKSAADIWKSVLNIKYVCFNEILWLIITKINLKIKYRSHRYNINKPRSRHEHKYTKWKMCLGMMMIVCVMLQLSNIGNSNNEKIKWVKKSVAYIENRVSLHKIP